MHAAACGWRAFAWINRTLSLAEVNNYVNGLRVYTNDCTRAYTRAYKYIHADSVYVEYICTSSNYAERRQYVFDADFMSPICMDVE